jgi:hypothetical protein
MVNVNVSQMYNESFAEVMNNNENGDINEEEEDMDILEYTYSSDKSFVR